MVVKGGVKVMVIIICQDCLPLSCVKTAKRRLFIYVTEQHCFFCTCQAFYHHRIILPVHSMLSNAAESSQRYVAPKCLRLDHLSNQARNGFTVSFFFDPPGGSLGFSPRISGMRQTSAVCRLCSNEKQVVKGLASGAELVL
jgi:hypothetical protein